jgi:hypothetical protein
MGTNLLLLCSYESRAVGVVGGVGERQCDPLPAVAFRRPRCAPSAISLLTLPSTA